MFTLHWVGSSGFGARKKAGLIPCSTIYLPCVLGQITCPLRTLVQQEGLDVPSSSVACDPLLQRGWHSVKGTLNSASPFCPGSTRVAGDSWELRNSSTSLMYTHKSQNPTQQLWGALPPPASAPLKQAQQLGDLGTLCEIVE